MSDIVPIQAVQSAQTGEQASQSTSMAAYQRWLADSGNMPLGSVMTQHPSQIAAAALDQAGGLTRTWNSHIDKTSDMFSTRKIDSMVNELRHGDKPPGPASAPLGSAPSTPVSTAAAAAPASLEEAEKTASASIIEATALSIEAQWRQTAALVEHDLSNQVLMSSMQSSISAGKEINEGLDSLLRG